MSSSTEPSVFLEELLIRNFRNVRELELSFSPTANLFIGHNGHGKTNCLEAVALALSLRPMQSLKNFDLIKFDEPQAFIEAKLRGAQQIDIEVDIFPHGKRAKLNHQTMRKASALATTVSLVSFIPAELGMVQGASALRRRALDQAAYNLFFEHLASLKAYEKILGHRNKLLKSWPLDHASLKVFSELLIEEGAQVIWYRLKAIELMNDLFQQKIQAILGARHSGTIDYLQYESIIKNQTITDLKALLKSQHDDLCQQEMRRKVTLWGPHLDDVVLMLDGHCAKKTASRGQSRAIVLAFKLAHMLAVEQVRGFAPIVVLDDIVSELDQVTKANLFLVIAALKTQSFFSATDLTTFGSQFDNAHCFKLEHGTLFQQNL